MTIPGATLDLARPSGGHYQASSLGRSSRLSARLNRDFQALDMVFRPLKFQAAPELDFRQSEQAFH
jgi:hypothetical protein